MSANANILDLVKGNSTLVRPLFSPGLLLRDDDLRAGVDYTRDLSRLLVRSLFGCGVVCGLEVGAELRCGKLVVTVDAGVALSCIGDPIHVPEPKTVTIDPTCGKEIPDKLWVTLCRTDKCCAPRTAACACDDEDGGSVCTREQEGFEIRVVKDLPKDCICEEQLRPEDRPLPDQSMENSCWCADPCRDCNRDHYGGQCACKCCDDCLVLAVLNKTVRRDDGEIQPHPGAPQSTAAAWIPNHSVRRFVRPVLIRDPLVYKEQYRGEPCGERATATVEDSQKLAMTNDIAAADEAARRAGQAATAALRKGAEGRAAAAAGRMVEAEAAAKAAAEMAVEAEVSAKALAESATAAALTARREVNKITAERTAAEKTLADKLSAEVAAIARPAAEAATTPDAPDQALRAPTGAKRSDAKSNRKTAPAKPSAS